MSQLLEIAIIGIFGLFLLILLIAAVAGIVHAIRESVRQHRRPPIFSFVTWGLSLLFFIIYVTTRTLWKTQEIDLYLFGRFGDFWEKFLQGAFFVLLTTATGFYVFTSFRLPPEESGFAEGEDGDSDEDELDEEDREELRRRAAMRAAMAKRNGIMRVLSIALPLVLDAILIGALLIVNVAVHYEHNVTELRSPDGDRIIYVDNSFCPLLILLYFSLILLISSFELFMFLLHFLSATHNIITDMISPSGYDSSRTHGQYRV